MSMTTTIEVTGTGETCTACDEEILIERFGADEVSLSCGCRCASALC